MTRRTAGENLERTLVRALGALPPPVRARFLGAAPAGDGTALDAHMAMLMTLAKRCGRTFRPDVSVVDLRRAYARMNRVLGLDAPAAVEARDVRIDAPGTTASARLYRPAGTSRALPLLVYFHGGGFVIGDVDSYDHAARFFAAAGNIAVLSVEYALGPERRFPRAHDDAFAAYAHACTHAATLGADAARIGVGGDSAGGCLAAAISALAADRGLPAPPAQLLIYPALDNAGDYASRRGFERGVPLTPAAIAWFGARSRAADDDLRSPLLSPLFAPVPLRTRTHLLAAGFDPLVDEGRAYAERLREAGAEVVYDVRPTLAHAFLNVAGVVPEARRALETAIAATARALREGAAVAAHA